MPKIPQRTIPTRSNVSQTSGTFLKSPNSPTPNRSNSTINSTDYYKYTPSPGSQGFTAQEFGFPGAVAGASNMPPGDGAYTTPNFLTFASLIQSAARAFRYTSDEALLQSPTNARAMRRDPVLMGALRARQRKTAQLTWHINPDDETDPAEAEAAKYITSVIQATPKFQKMKMHLLEAIWFGKYSTEQVMRFEDMKGKNTLKIIDHVPVNGDKIRFMWDGTPGILVYPGYPGSKIATDYGLAHFLSPKERQQYIIHEHEPDDVDWIEMEQGGAIHGVGVRGRLYWFWWLKQQVFGLLMNYLQRFANGLTIFYYNAGDPQAKQEAQQAAMQQFTQTALLYPRWNSERPDTNSVQRLEVGTASQSLIQHLVDEYFDDVMVRYILGQVLSSTAEPTGMGSSVAELHGETLAEIIKYDAVDLGETFQTDLINVLYKYNCPGIKPGKFEFEVDTPNSKDLFEYGQILYDWGLTLDEDQAYKLSQWNKPKPGAGLISKLGQMQPMTPGQQGVAQGVPSVGQMGQPQQNGQMVADQNGQPVQMKRKSLDRGGNGKLQRHKIPQAIPKELFNKIENKRVRLSRSKIEKLNKFLQANGYISKA